MSGIPGLIRALLPPAAPAGVQGPAPLEAAQLRALLDIGDVLTIRVLGLVAGRSTLEIAGRPVMAAIPEGVAPGDLLQVRVEGFTQDQVLLKLLAQVTVADQRADEPAASPGSASAPLPASPPIVTPRATASEEPLPADPPSLPGHQPPSGQATAAAPPPLPASVGEVAVETADNLRARLAAFRLSTASGVLSATRQSPQPSPAEPTLPESPSPQARPSAQPAASGSGGARTAAPATTAGSQTPASRVPVPQAPPSQPQSPALLPPGAAMLRGLRIPVTPTTLAAARIALSGTAGHVSQTLAALQRALPAGSTDPRVQQVRAIAEFVATLDPARPEVLPARLEAYVEHVLSRELRTRDALGTFPDPASGQLAPLPPLEVSTARLAVAREALAVNLKTQVLALLAGTSEGDAARAALQNALVGITATQLQTLSLQAGNPQAIVLPLPLPFPAGGQQAYLRIERDGRAAAQPISAESFHIALVLQTKHHGTVAVELLCAQRALSVEVKTERVPAAAAFQRHLPELGERLERLAYRVVRLGAEVAPITASPATPVPAEPAKRADGGGLDLHA